MPSWWCRVTTPVWSIDSMRRGPGPWSIQRPWADAWRAGQILRD